MKNNFLALFWIITGVLCFRTTGCSKRPADIAAGIRQVPGGDNVINLQYAKNFKIEYLKNGMKLVTDGQEKRALLLKKGQSAPGAFKDLPVIYLPLCNAIYTNSTQVAFLRAFNDESLFDSIIGVRQKAEEWDFDAMKIRMQSGQIKDIGDTTPTSTTYNYEIIQALNPGIVFTSQGMGTEQLKLMEMLDQAHIFYLFDGSSMESDYRGTLEWLKFYAAFYNLEKEADVYFEKALAGIEEMKAKIKTAPKPKAGWGIVVMGKVYVENGGSKCARMIKDAGADYIFDDIGAGTDGVSNISVEELYMRLAECDIFINRGMPQYGPDKKSIIVQAPVLADVPCFKNNHVWQIMDNFWNTYHNIDQKYIELAAIFHPELYKSFVFKHFRLMPDIAE